MNRKRVISRRFQIEDEEYERQIARRIAEREAEIAQREYEQRQQDKAREVRVVDRLERMRVDHEAGKRLTAEITRQQAFETPKVGWTAADFLDEDDQPLEVVVEGGKDGLHFRGNNTLLVAEHKTGKTTLAMNLAASIADGRPFLDQYPVHMPYGRVAFFNYEMSARQFRIWLRSTKIENPDRIIPVNLRGRWLPFWDESEMLRLAEWLLHNEVGFIILDPAARAWRGLVEAEGDNVQLAEFFGALDELKRLGDVSNLLITTHTPRSADGRARGGGEVEAWPDGNWYLSKTNGDRSLRAEGRDVHLDPVALDFDEESNRLSVAGPVKIVNSERDVESVMDVLKREGGEIVGRNRFRNVLMKGVMSHDRFDAAAEIAAENGLLEIEVDGVTNVYRVA